MMLAKRPLRTILVLTLVTALFVAGCGPAASPTPQPEPSRPLRPTFTPTPELTDTPTPVPPTPTPADTPTPVPTDTPAEPPTDTPEPPTPTPETGPLAVIAGSGQVNVRSGPGTAYPIVGQVSTGMEMEIVGRNQAGDWWQICCVNGQEAWIVARLVTIEGSTDGVAVAANIPPPPPTNTPRPVPPTNTPAPTPTPEPQFAFVKHANPPPRPNSNPIITFFGMAYTADLLGAVGGNLMVVEGPLGRNQATCEPAVLRGDPGLPSEFIYNCKVEFMGTAEGNYRAWLADPGGSQISEVWDNSVAGEMRTFTPRWKQR